MSPVICLTAASFQVALLYQLLSAPIHSSAGHLCDPESLPQFSPKPVAGIVLGNAYGTSVCVRPHRFLVSPGSGITHLILAFLATARSSHRPRPFSLTCWMQHASSATHGIAGAICASKPQSLPISAPTSERSGNVSPPATIPMPALHSPSAPTAGTSTASPSPVRPYRRRHRDFSGSHSARPGKTTHLKTAPNNRLRRFRAHLFDMARRSNSPSPTGIAPSTAVGCVSSILPSSADCGCVEDFRHAFNRKRPLAPTVPSIGGSARKSTRRSLTTH